MLRACASPAHREADPGTYPHGATPVRIIVDVVELTPEESILVVSSPYRTVDRVPVRGSASEAALGNEMPAGFHPLAVRFELSDQTPDCTCLATTPRGPRRFSLSLPAALALVAAGVHGIVTSVTRSPR